MCLEVSHSFIQLMGLLVLLRLVLLRPAAVAVVGAAVAGVPLRLERVANKTVGGFVQLMVAVLVH